MHTLFSCNLVKLTFSFQQKTSDFREIDESSYNEWLKKEEDFQRILLDKENEWKRKEQEYIKEIETKKRELGESLKQVEEYKSKIVRYQEDKDQLEQYQLQEMSKIKHLVSVLVYQVVKDFHRTFSNLNNFEPSRLLKVSLTLKVFEFVYY
jgi:hypothetical protein